MIANTSDQPFVFVMYLAWGLVCGFLFHMWQKLSAKFPKPAVIAGDSLLGISLCIATWVINLLLNYGQFRLYYIPAMFGGFVIYYKFFGALLDKGVVSLYNLFTSKGVNKDEQTISR